MADQKLTALTELAQPANEDYLYVVDDPTGTPASRRTSVGALRGDVYNVKSYGAAGDGSTDDTTAIQNAINAAEASTYGGDVIFPPGQYRTSATLTCDTSGTPVRLLGYGMAEIKTLSATPDPILDIEDPTTGTTPDSNGMVAIDGLRLDGWGKAQGQIALRLHNVNQCKVTNLRINDVDTGIELVNTSNGYCEHNDFEHVSISSVETGIRHTSIGDLPIGDVTNFNDSTDTWTLAGHGLQEDDAVWFTAKGASPSNYSTGTRYFVIAAGLTTDDFRLSATKGGSVIDGTGYAATWTLRHDTPRSQRGNLFRHVRTSAADTGIHVRCGRSGETGQGYDTTTADIGANMYNTRYEDFTAWHNGSQSGTIYGIHLENGNMKGLKIAACMENISSGATVTSAIQIGAEASNYNACDISVTFTNTYDTLYTNADTATGEEPRLDFVLSSPNNERMNGARNYLRHNWATSSTYTVGIEDVGALLEFSNATGTTVTIPTDATEWMPNGAVIDFVQYGAGPITISHSGTLRGHASTAGQYTALRVIKRSADDWYTLPLSAARPIEVSSAVTLDDSHGVVNVDTSGGAVTVTLPSCNASDGKSYLIRNDSGTNDVTVNRAVPDTFDEGGATSKTLSTDGATIGIFSVGGTEWKVAGTRGTVT